MSYLLWLLVGGIFGFIVAAIAMHRFYGGKIAHTEQLDRALAVETQKAIYAQRVESDLKLQTEQLQEQTQFLQGQLNSERIRNAALNQELETNRETMETFEAKWQKDFQKFLSTTLEETRVAFEKQAKETTEEKQVALHKTMTELVTPLAKMLGEYEEKIVKMDVADQARDAVLKDKITELTSAKDQLVSVLKTNKGVGDWGELELERLLEHSGLIRGPHYQMQQSIANGRPDVHIYLPGNRTILVDCKAIQVRLEDIASTDDPQENAIRQAKFVTSLKNAIKSLHSKAYQEQLSDTTDFVVLYVPRESMLSTALQADPGLCEEAAKKNIVLAGPFNLIALLKIVQLGWHQAEISDNAKIILELGKELQKRATAMAVDFTKVGSTIEKLAGYYADTQKHLEGPRGVIRQTKKLEEIGAKTNTSILSENELPDLRPLLSADAQMLDLSEEAETALLTAFEEMAEIEPVA